MSKNKVNCLFIMFLIVVVYILSYNLNKSTISSAMVIGSITKSEMLEKTKEYIKDNNINITDEYCVSIKTLVDKGYVKKRKVSNMIDRYVVVYNYNKENEVLDYQDKCE